jgi:hypothetical protein
LGEDIPYSPVSGGLTPDYKTFKVARIPMSKRLAMLHHALIVHVTGKPVEYHYKTKFGPRYVYIKKIANDAMFGLVRGK